MQPWGGAAVFGFKWTVAGLRYRKAGNHLEGCFKWLGNKKKEISGPVLGWSYAAATLRTVGICCCAPKNRPEGDERSNCTDGGRGARYIIPSRWSCNRLTPEDTSAILKSWRRFVLGPVGTLRQPEVLHTNTTGARIFNESCLATEGKAHKKSLENFLTALKTTKQEEQIYVAFPSKMSQQTFGSCSITQKVHSSFPPSYWQLTRPLTSQVTFSVNTSMTAFPVAAQPSDRLQPGWKHLKWGYRETLTMDICVPIKALFR